MQDWGNLNLVPLVTVIINSVYTPQKLSGVLWSNVGKKIRGLNREGMHVNIFVIDTEHMIEKSII